MRKNSYYAIEPYLFWAAMIIITIIAIIITISIMTMAFSVQNLICASDALPIGFDYRYSISGGCEIDIGNNHWIPIDSYFYSR